MIDDEDREEIEDKAALGSEVLRQEWFHRMQAEAEHTEVQAVEALINLVTRPLEGGELIENRFIKAASVGNSIKSLRAYIATPDKWIEDRKELLEEEKSEQETMV
jgi:hypothetical protein